MRVQQTALRYPHRFGQRAQVNLGAVFAAHLTRPLLEVFEERVAHRRLGEQAVPRASRGGEQPLHVELRPHPLWRRHQVSRRHGALQRIGSLLPAGQSGGVVRRQGREPGLGEARLVQLRSRPRGQVADARGLGEEPDLEEPALRGDPRVERLRQGEHAAHQHVGAGHDWPGRARRIGKGRRDDQHPRSAQGAAQQQRPEEIVLPQRVGRDDDRAGRHRARENRLDHAGLLDAVADVVVRLHGARRRHGPGLGTPAFGLDARGVVGREGPRMEDGWHQMGAEPLAFEQPARRRLHVEHRRPLDDQRAILPGGAGVVFPEPHAAEDGLATIRVVLGDVVEDDLAVIPHQVVGHPDNRNQAAGPEGEVGGVRDVDVHLHEIMQPALAVCRATLLKASGGSDRIAKLLLRLTQRGLLGCVFRRERDGLLERTFQDRHPQPAVVGLVEVLVEDDEVLGQRAGLVVALDARGQRVQILADVHRRDAVDRPRFRPAPHIVNPQHVILLGLFDGASELELERLVEHVVDAVALAETVARRPLDESVEFRLGVGFLRQQRHLERHEQPRVGAPVLSDAGANTVEFPCDVQKGRQRRGTLCRRQIRRQRQFGFETVCGLPREDGNGLRPATLAEQAVEGQQNLLQNETPRPGRDPIDHPRGRRLPCRRQRGLEYSRPRFLHGTRQTLRRVECGHLGHVLCHRFDGVCAKATPQRHRQARHGLRGRTEAVQGRVKRGGCRLPRERLSLRHSAMVPPGAGPAGALTERRGDTHLHRVIAARHPLDAQSRAVAQQSSAPEVPLRAEQPVGTTGARIEVEAGVEPCHRAHGEQASAAFDAVLATADEPLEPGGRQAADGAEQVLLCSEGGQAASA